MEEVDAIIMPILRDIGCTLPPDVSSIKQLDSDLFYHAAVLTLRSINAATSSTGNIKHPPTMPQGKAARFRVCSAVCTEIKEKGYAAELGYEAFLYPTEQEMRKVLRWLVDKLPRVEEQGGDGGDLAGGAGAGGAGARGGAGGAGAARQQNVMKRVNEALKVWTQKQWSPLLYLHGQEHTPCFPFHGVALSLPIVEKSAPHVTPESIQYVRTMQPVLSAQPVQRTQFIASVMGYNALETMLAREKERAWSSSDSASVAHRKQQLNSTLQQAFRNAVKNRTVPLSRGDFSSYAIANQPSKDTAFARRTQFEQEQEVVQAQVVSEVGTVTIVNAGGVSAQEQEQAEEELKKQRETQLEQLQAQLNELIAQGNSLEIEAEQFISKARQVEAELTDLNQTTTRLEEQYKVKKRTLDLLPEAQKNLAELTQLVDASSARLVDLATEWESHRQPLINKLRQQKQLLQDRKDNATVKVEQIKAMREEMRIKAEDARDKDKVLKQVQEELANLPKSVNRQVYVRRIMDIMKNLTKQKQQIDTILADVRKLQKEINTVSSTSARSFALADEVVFQTAKKLGNDPLLHKCYKSVLELRQGFVTLVQIVEASGVINSEAREISLIIDELEARNTSNNMERLESDLAQVKKENAQLEAKLKK